MSCSPLQRVVGVTFTILTLLLLARAIIVEPFEVSTGSMAPTLRGVHRQCTCPKCGNLVVVGTASASSPPDHYQVKCPKCAQANLGLDAQPDLPGQRILVDKLAFEWRSPRRWEVVVFRGPDENATPFVKRVVGLPGESVQIKNGEVYIDGALATKPAALVRQTKVPIQIAPLTTGNGQRAQVGTDYWVYNGLKVDRIETLYLLSDGAEQPRERSVHYQSAGRHAIRSPCRLGPDEYFVLGDNSAVSDDSRFWPSPGVRASALIGPVIFPRLDSDE